jgi:hypothetical protein
MFCRELNRTLPQSISKEFSYIINELATIQEPGKIFDLEIEPTKIELLCLIDSCKTREISLTHFSKLNYWMLCLGTENEPYKPDVDDDELVDIYAHYHPKFLRPSFMDVINVNPKWKEIVFSRVGMLSFSGPKFHPKTGLPWKKEDRGKLTQFDLAYLITMNKADDFDAEIVAKMKPNIIFRTWREIPEKNPFTNFKSGIAI